MQIHSVLKKSVIATGVAIALASSGAQAISAGTDLNLSAHAAAGGMAGAAYTKPQEVSAAVAGNPATLTQFPGMNFNFGAALISLTDINVDTDTSLPGISGAVPTGTDNFHAEHHSDADNYIIPTIGVSFQLSPDLFIGFGLEADAGLGADYRDEPLQLLAGSVNAANNAAGGGLIPLLNGPIAAPVNVEVISFNANFAAAYKATDRLSVGGSVTLGFGLAQLGTTGTTTGFDGFSDLVVDGLVGAPTNNGTIENGGVLSDWGGTTSSVHDIGFGFTLGSTYLVADGIMSSLTVKSPLKYNFRNIMYGNPSTTGGALIGSSGKSDGWQDLAIEQPLEIIVGIALEDVLVKNLLVELDVAWKNWADAEAYQDAWKNQFLVNIGAQYSTGNWKLRAGYSWAEDILQKEPESTLGDLYGLGNLPLGDGAAALDAATGNNIVEPVAQDFVKIVQMSLLPVIWQHTVTAGVGYEFTKAVRVDAFVAYAFSEKDSRDLNDVATATDAGLTNLGLGAPYTGSQSSMSVEVDSEIMAGVGLNIALP
jgi:long-chain fatty acid transport protein